MIARLLPWGALAFALLGMAAWTFFHLWRTADERADKAEAVIIAQRNITRIVTEYVHEIQYRPVPESVIASRVDRLCEQRMREDRPGADGAAAADAADRRARDFDRELVNAWKNGRQLARLQEAARAAGCAD